PFCSFLVFVIVKVKIANSRWKYNMPINYRIDGTKDWFDNAIESMETYGFALLERIFDREMCAQPAERMLEIRENVFRELAQKNLSAPTDYPVIPLLPYYDSFFLQFLKNDELVRSAERWLGADCILRNHYGVVVDPVELNADGGNGSATNVS